MVYIMITTWSPASKVAEVGKKFIEVRKTPLDRSIMKRVVPMGVRMLKDGIRNVGIYDVKPGKTEEALGDLTKRMLAFSEIEGFKSEMEVLMSGTEAMPLIGLKMPEE
ncbi:MAG: hypothetical protein ACTSPS_10850 [Promethearchaeota archaeon]